MEKIKRPAWILCNPRCGSSYLCELLNNTGKFEPVRKERSFGEWLKYYQSVSEFAASPPRFNKCTRHQFTMLLGNMGRREFETLLPDVRFIVIHRKDLYAQAVSLYIAKCTDQYHVFSEDSLVEYLDQKIEYNEELLLKMYKNACGYPEAWSGFLEGSGYLQIFYEDLIANPRETLTKAASYLEVALTDDEIERCVSRHRLLPTTRPESEEFIRQLKALTSAS